MVNKKEATTIFSECDLFITNLLLNEDNLCLRDFTISRGNTNNAHVSKKLDNLIKLGLIKKEPPKGKRINYSITNKLGLKKLNHFLKESYKFYNNESN